MIIMILIYVYKSIIKYGSTYIIVGIDSKNGIQNFGVSKIHSVILTWKIH